MRPATARRRAAWYRRYRPGRLLGRAWRPSVFRLAVGFEPGHHGAQLGTNLLDHGCFLLPAVGVESGPSGLVLEDPGPGEGAILDLAKDLPHLIANRRADHPRPADVVAELGRVADAVAHVAHAALVHQVDDQLHLMQALEVGQLGLVARLDQGLEAGLDQRGEPTTEHRLLAEEIGLGLLFEGRLEHAGHGRPDP